MELKLTSVIFPCLQALVFFLRALCLLELVLAATLGNMHKEPVAEWGRCVCALSTQGVGGSSSEVLPETGDWRVELLSAVSRNCIPLMPFKKIYFNWRLITLQYCIDTFHAF